MSYLVAPLLLEDFRLGEFLTDLYSKQIFGKIPTGLILYENNNPEAVSLISNIDHNIDISAISNSRSRSVTTSRYWAKHQDLPLQLFHLLLHCYYLKKSNTISEDAFKYCWNHYLISPTILTDFRPRIVRDCNNEIIKTPAGNKTLMFLEKILARTSQLPIDKRISLIKHEIDTEFPGDNKYNAYKKNFVSLLKHLKVIDSTGEITDSGFKLYHLGLVNGANSKVFKDYFTKEVLTTGHHLDLLLDLDQILRYNSKPLVDCLSIMEQEYESKGYIKRNPNRRVTSRSSVGFLKYECILWRSLGLLAKEPHRVSVNWKYITSICGLPDL